jgi:hypothetical protein
MKKYRYVVFSVFACIAVCFFIVAGLYAQDRFALKAPNGISFSEIRGYEKWQFVAPSYRTDVNEVREILANDKMIEAYVAGIPGNGKSFPDGSIIVKIGYSLVKDPDFGAAQVPDKLKRVEFIVKDTKRFPDTSGWGYARFVYDAAKDTFSPFGADAKFVDQCYACHEAVKAADYIFTKYPAR